MLTAIFSGWVRVSGCCRGQIKRACQPRAECWSSVSITPFPGQQLISSRGSGSDSLSQAPRPASVTRASAPSLRSESMRALGRLLRKSPYRACLSSALRVGFQRHPAVPRGAPAVLRLARKGAAARAGMRLPHVGQGDAQTTTATPPQIIRKRLIRAP